ncbi:MAG: sensor domain-containing diguanylate cyclase [Candidatus Sericytochromatia bacterium]|nr:sensor domain-containing diguanylate cyclase [Candidatus Sericytochromatia bacterium]
MDQRDGAATRIVPDASPGGQSLERLLYLFAALEEMAEQLTTNPNPRSSIQAIVRMATGALGIGRASLLLYQPERQQLEPVVLADEPTGLLAVSPDVRRWFLDEAGTLIAHTRRHDLLDEFRAANETILALLPATVWLPLAVNRHFLGLLMVGDTPDQRPLGRTEADLLILIGRQLAVALHNHQLTTSLTRANRQLGFKVRQLEQLYDISRAITSTLDRLRITDELMLRTVELLDARKGFLLLKDESGEWLESAAVFGFEERETPFVWPVGAAWLAPVLGATGPCTLSSEGLPAELGARVGLVSAIAYQERQVGVIAVFDKESRHAVSPFDPEDDVPLLANLASLAATAIENARLYELATTDGLTRLYIRRHFEHRLAEELRRAERYGTPLSVLIMDIDHFKRFNDTYGHQTGDEVLKAVARTIRASVRDVDVPGRYGGEELLVLMPETDMSGALAMAERVREAIAGCRVSGPGGEALHVTVSVGVATWPRHARTATALLEAADRALYRSKASGRNCSHVADDTEETVPVSPAC